MSQEKRNPNRQQNEIEDGVETSLWLFWLNKMYDMVDMKNKTKKKLPTKTPSLVSNVNKWNEQMMRKRMIRTRFAFSNPQCAVVMSILLVRLYFVFFCTQSRFRSVWATFFLHFYVALITNIGWILNFNSKVVSIQLCSAYFSVPSSLFCHLFESFYSTVCNECTFKTQNCSQFTNKSFDKTLNFCLVSSLVDSFLFWLWMISFVLELNRLCATFLNNCHSVAHNLNF